MTRSTSARATTALALLSATTLAALGLTTPGATAAPQEAGTTDYTRYVNPFIGTGDATTLTGHSPGSGLVGQGTPAAHLPFGMLQWGPDTDSVTNNSRHYNYADGKITGFSLHNEFGYEPQAVSFLPYAGDVTTSPGSDLSSYYQSFSHSDETATAGTYTVTSGSKITTKLSATTRAGIATVAYPSDTTPSLIINLQDPTGNTNGNNNVSVDPATGTVSGWVGDVSLQNAKGASRLYFSASFDRPLDTYATFNGSTLTPSGTSSSGNATGTVLTFAPSAQPLGIRTAVSWVSVANAQANLAAEIPQETTFAQVSSAAHTSWQTLLGRFAVNDPKANPDDLTNFYSALYRTVSSPTTFSDDNGQYHGWDGQTHTVAPGHTEYNGWTSWNGSRTGTMAFLATFFPKEASDVGQSIVDSSRLDGFNHNVGQGAGFFDGDSGDYAQLPELYAFGARDFDTRTGLNMLLQSANQGVDNVVRSGNDQYLAKGYVPAGTGQPLPTEETQSYAQFDFNTAQLAAAIGQQPWSDQLLARSDNWRNVLYQAATSAVGSGYMWGRTADGGWSPGFCAECGDWTSGDRTDGTTYWEEASSAQSSYWPTYNLAGLIQAQGGAKAFTSRLDDFFSALNDGTHSSHYYQGNEPDVMAPWEYDWAGMPSGTQSTIRRILTQSFLNTPGGMPGNDDWSSESTWQSWAMMGIFPEIPAVGGFAVASPLFAQLILTFENGKTLTINGQGAARNAPYVRNASLNGKTYDSPWLPLSSVTNGEDNTLSFALGTSKTSWGQNPTQNVPPSFGAPTLPVAQSTTGSSGSKKAPYRSYDLGSTRDVTGFTVHGTLSGGFSLQASSSGDPNGSWTTLQTVGRNTLATQEYVTTPTNTRWVRIIAAKAGVPDSVPTMDIHGVVSSPDLAQGKPTTSSGGSCSPNEGPGNAVDGNDTSKWCINAGGSAAWLTVDLGSEQTVDRFVVKNAGLVGEPDDSNTADYTVQSSATGDPSGLWTDLATVTGNTMRDSFTAITPTKARYLRLYITKGLQGGGDNVARIYEFGAFGPTR